MNQELSQYKANLLSGLKKSYNANCINVTQYYNNIINIISKSRAINKAQQINTVKNLLASSISNLTKKYNADSLTIQKHKQMFPELYLNKSKMENSTKSNFQRNLNEEF